MISPIDVFNSWVSNGKDEGMEKNHSLAVHSMIQMLIGKSNKQFSFIDAGCGNGWVVRKVNLYDLCSYSIGVDGSKNMIDKAKKIDSTGNYICSDLMKWKPKEKVDFVHSMEVLYYFENPSKLLKHIYDFWLKKEGTLIVGVDFYKENIISHSWPESLNTTMTLLSKKEWFKCFTQSGFRNVELSQINSSNDFEGTLVIKGNS
jgi:trans-aconitate methyltransferase|tara:strand:- start:371 stop:979 length:609 start_codon:yes stop_codon:yes gene_type:complete